MSRKIIKISLIVLLISFCSNFSYAQSSIHGTINYQNDVNKPLKNVKVFIKNSENIIIDSTITNNSGFYEFNNLQEGTYSLNATNSTNPGGIDLGDSFLILSYLNGSKSLNQLQLKAADVTDDGIINWDDYWKIVTNWYQNGTTSFINKWIFENPTITLASKKDMDDPPCDWGGSSTGDVNGSFDPGVLSDNSVFLFYNEKYNMNINQEKDVNFNLTQNVYINAIGLVIDFPEELAEIKNIESKIENFDYKIENSKIIISWINTSEKALLLKKGKPLFTIKIITTNNFTTDKCIKFRTSKNSHLINPKGENYNDVVINVPKIINNNYFSNLEINNDNNSRIYPNPVINNANIEYNIKEQSNVTINIYDINGRLINCICNKYQNAGIYKVNYNTEELNSGLYFYSININDSNSYNKKFYVVK